ncbi:MAG: rod-binding protein [Treponema sp.]|jgi:flagellar protein FlgJ|nr:rod-binding protein [Treponema sp.]
MNTAGIGNQYILNQGYTPFETAGINGAELSRMQTLPSFAEQLEKASAERADANAVPQGRPGQDGKPAKPQIDKDSKLFEMCRELETFLLKTLISSMRNTVQKSGFMDTGFAGKFYEDMLYDEYAKSFANNAGFGFAEMAYMELDRKAKSGSLPD